MSKYTEMTEEQWNAAFDEFTKKYQAPQPEPIKVLDLIMRKENARDILTGIKKVEIREWSEHYQNRLTSQGWIWKRSMSSCVPPSRY